MKLEWINDWRDRSRNATSFDYVRVQQWRQSNAWGVECVLLGFGVGLKVIG